MKDADALVILTEWNQFRNLDLAKVKRLLKTPVFFNFWCSVVELELAFILVQMGMFLVYFLAGMTKMKKGNLSL